MGVLRTGLLLLVAACAAAPASPPAGDDTTATTPPRARATLVADGFTLAVLTTTRSGDDRLFVVDQPGLVWALRGEERTAVLDIVASTGQDRDGGLVGLAFHPTDPERLFVWYANAPGAVILAEYRLPLGDGATATAVRTLLAFNKPSGFGADPVAALTTHNGGTIAFGPDGYLYVAVGDGGGADDPYHQAQDTTSLWGKILRIDVDRGDPYAIPPSNPFADGDGGRPEVFAWGLRNPYRISIDGTDIWIGDVGQNRREEVDRISTLTPGANLGWPLLEGTRCNKGTAEQCADPALVPPIHEYRHRERCAVIGGPVYRGTAIPALTGAYLFGDFCTGDIRYLTVSADGSVRIRFTGVSLPGLTSIELSAAGEVLLTAGSAVFQMSPGA